MENTSTDLDILVGFEQYCKNLEFLTAVHDSASMLFKTRRVFVEDLDVAFQLSVPVAHHEV